MERSDKKKIAIFFGIIGFIILIICVWNLISYSINGEFKGKEYRGIDIYSSSTRFLNWEVRETIRYDYEKCKDINRHKPIKRVFKRDYMLPMCPENYVVLYDENQKIVFMFNQENENKENPTILTVSITCDNSTGEC